jgi:hypothetical protein
MSFIVESDEAYAIRKGARASILKEILRSPIHALEMECNPKESTPAMKLGTDIHAAILQPDVFERYIVAPKFDKRTKEGKAAALDFEASHPGRTFIDEEKYAILAGCMESLRLHKVASEQLATGKCEQTVVWDEDGLLCKARPDIMRDGVLIDVKTTQDASPAAFARQVANLKYTLQAAHYVRGVSKVTGVEHETFRVVAIETKPPFAIAVYELDFGTLEFGRAQWRNAIELYRECSAMNHWPGYKDEIQSLAVPSWVFNQAEE